MKLKRLIFFFVFTLILTFTLLKYLTPKVSANNQSGYSHTENIGYYLFPEFFEYEEYGGYTYTLDEWDNEGTAPNNKYVYYSEEPYEDNFSSGNNNNYDKATPIELKHPYLLEGSSQVIQENVFENIIYGDLLNSDTNDNADDLFDYYKFTIDKHYKAYISLQSESNNAIRDSMSLNEINYYPNSTFYNISKITDSDYDAISMGLNDYNLEYFGEMILEPGGYVIKINPALTSGDNFHYKLHIWLELDETKPFSPKFPNTNNTCNIGINLCYPMNDLNFFKEMIYSPALEQHVKDSDGILDGITSDKTMVTKELSKFKLQGDTYVTERRVAFMTTTYKVRQYGDNIFGNTGILEPHYNKIEYLKYRIEYILPTDWEDGGSVQNSLMVKVVVVNSAQYVYNFESNELFLLDDNQGDLQIQNLYIDVNIDNKDSINTTLPSESFQRVNLIADYPTIEANPNVGEYIFNTIKEEGLSAALSYLEEEYKDSIGKFVPIYNKIQFAYDIYGMWQEQQEYNENPFNANEVTQWYLPSSNRFIFEADKPLLVRSTDNVKFYDQAGIDLITNRKLASYEENLANVHHKTNLAIKVSYRITNATGSQTYQEFSDFNHYSYYNVDKSIEPTGPVINDDDLTPIELNLGETNFDYKFEGVQATDNFDTNLDVNFTHNINTNQLGQYIVTYSVTDTSGNTTTAERIITVVDKVKPVISGSNYRVLNFNSTKPNWLNDVTATDNYDGTVPVRVIYDDVDTTVNGVYTVIYESVDSSGNVATLETTVVVADQYESNNTQGTAASLNLTVPSNKPNDLRTTIYATLHKNMDNTIDKDYYQFTIDQTRSGNISVGMYGTNLNYVTVKLTGNNVSYSQTSPYPGATGISISNVTLLPGTYYIEVSSSASDNRNSYALSVNFQDTIAPVISGASDQTIKLNDSFNVSTGVTAIDNINGTVDYTVTGTVDPTLVGRYVLTYTASDLNGNTTTVTRVIVVTDEHESNNTTGTATTVNLSPTSAKPNDLSGSIHATLHKDSNNIIDKDYYVFTLTKTYTGNISVGFYNTEFSYVTIKLTGNGVSQSATNPYDGATGVSISNITLSPGTYYVEVSSSSYDFSNRYNLSINFHDTDAPVISGATDTTIKINTTFNASTGVTAIDYINGTVTYNVSGSVDTTVLGRYILTYTATDLNGNTSTVTRVVIVTDEYESNDTTGTATSVNLTTPSTKPNDLTGSIQSTLHNNVSNVIDKDYYVFTISKTYTGTVSVGFYNTNLNYVTIKLTGNGISQSATNPYEGATGVSIPNVTLTPGTYYVEVSSGSYDNSNRYTFSVSLQDQVAPTISGATDTTIKATSSFNPLTGVSATDNINGTVAVSVSGTVDPNVPGRYVLTYTAVDSNGNTSTVTRIVLVTDQYETNETSGTATSVTLSPLSTKPNDLSATMNATLHQNLNSTIDKDYYVFTISKTYTGTVSVGFYNTNLKYVTIKLTGNGISQTATNPFEGATGVSISNVTLTPGTYYVEVSSGSYDNSNKYNFSVNLQDNVAPTISGATDTTIKATSSFNPLTGVTATDNINGTVAVSVSGTIDPNVPGRYVLTYTATDSNGNTSTVTRIVLVTDQYEANETSGTATSVTLTTPSTKPNDLTATVNATLHQNLNGTIDKDYYIFTVPKTYKGTVSVGFYNTSLKYVTISLTGNGISQSATNPFEGATGVSISNVTLTPGTYYVEVSSGSYDSSNKYNFSVNLQDNVAPTFSGVSNITITESTYSPLTGVTATDNIEGNVTSKIQVTGNFNPYVSGYYTLTYTVSDNNGNQTSITRAITVIDNYNTKDTSKTLSFGSTSASGYVSETSVNGTIDVLSDVDYYHIRLNSSYYVDLLLSGSFLQGSAEYKFHLTNYNSTISYYSSTFNQYDRRGILKTVLPAGDYYIKVYSTSGYSVSSGYNLNIKLATNNAPVITLNGSSSINVTKGSSYTELGATATDDYDTGLTVSTSSNVNTNLFGTYTVTYSVTDRGGLTTTRTRTVNVVDPYETGNTSSTAYDIGNFPSYMTSTYPSYNAYLTYNSTTGVKDVDYYKFTINSTYSSTISLSNIPSGFDYDVCLYSANDLNNALQCSTNGSNTSESINRTLYSGTYYIKVWSYSSTASNDSPYRLQLSLTKSSYY